MKIKKGDLITVLWGEEKGKAGKVLRTLPGANKIIVEKINMVKRHTRPSAKFPQGGIVEKEASLPVSRVMLLCPKCNQPTRIARKVGEGKKLRVCKKCGESIDEK